MHVCMYVAAVCLSNSNILFKTTIFLVYDEFGNHVTSPIQNILYGGYFLNIFFGFQYIDLTDYLQSLQIWLTPATQTGVCLEKTACFVVDTKFVHIFLEILLKTSEGVVPVS